MNQVSVKMQEVAAAAREASKFAYCPYSNFPVGAAVLTSDGSIFAGCNVENAAFGSTICAERNAVLHAIAKGKREILAVVVYTPTSLPSAPCGACRQVINEFGSQSEILCLCDGPKMIHKPLSALLPEAFGPDNLRCRPK